MLCNWFVCLHEKCVYIGSYAACLLASVSVWQTGMSVGVCGRDWVCRPSLCFTQHIHQKQRNAVKAQCVLHSALFTLTSIVALQGIWTVSFLLWITLTFTILYSLFPFLTTFLQSTTFPPKLIQSPRQITLGMHNYWLNQYL